MPNDQEATVELVTTRTAFEADSIAAALKARGIDARVLDTASAGVWGGAVQFSAVKVIVMAHEEAAARLALEEMKSESSSIDWEKVDVGDVSEGARMTSAAKTKRWMLTLVFLMVPLGLFVVSMGVDRGDAMLKTLGGTVLVGAMVMGVFVMAKEK